MKKYVIITFDIHGIGGLTLLTAGKADYLKKHDWQVFVFFNGQPFGNCMVESLNEYVAGCGFTNLGVCPQDMSSFERDFVLDKMEKILMIDNSIKNEIIIESHEYYSAFWGELLAERIHARHFYIATDEKYREDVQQFFNNLDFFEFKYNRHELFGRDNAVKKLFNGHRGIDKLFFDNPDKINFGMEQDPIQDVDNEKIDQIQRAELNIAYIGRTEKPYVPAVFKGVAEFAQNHSDKQIQFIIIGNITSRQILDNLFNKLDNVTLITPGAMSPIPRSLFAKLDVVIAGSQTAVFCSYENVPVIVANAESDKTSGCLYYDTKDRLYAEPKYSYAEILEKVLINREYDNLQPNLPERKLANWHYEQALKIMKELAAPELEYFTTKFKVDNRRNWDILFPFDRIERHAKIVIYGANWIQRMYQRQMQGYCELVAIVADNYAEFDDTILPPEELKNLSYDGIVIAEVPDQQLLDHISQNILRLTGKNNFIYTWKQIPLN